MWKTIGFRIESASIEQYPRVFKKVWFLDAVQVNGDCRSTSNICSGSEEFCKEQLAAIGGKEMP